MKQVLKFVKLGCFFFFADIFLEFLHLFSMFVFPSGDFLLYTFGLTKSHFGSSSSEHPTFNVQRCETSMNKFC